jgi:hypothetical protein
MRPDAFKFALASALCLTTATSWSQNSLTVPAEIVYTSNPNLTAVSEGSVSVLRVSPSYSIVNVDGAVRSEISLGAVLERSSNTALSANRADPRLGGNWQWSTPTSQVTLRGLLQEASARAAEFDSTGLVTVDSTRRDFELGVEWSQELSPLNRLILGAARNQVDYDTPLLIGYREIGTSAAFERTLAEETRVLIEARYARLQPDDPLLYARGTRSSLLLGYETALSELWTLNAGIGRVRTVDTVSRNSNIARMAIGYRGERLTSTLDWRREVAPSGSIGGYGRFESIRWTNAYALTPETTLDVSVGQFRELVAGADTGRMGSIVVRSTLTPFWSMYMGVEGRQADRALGPTARGHSVIAGLRYSRPDF